LDETRWLCQFPDMTVSKHVDVLIVGVGISGVGAAYRLQERCPAKSWTILDARERVGGTWDLFRYPGVRADSHMFTLSFPFHARRKIKSASRGYIQRALPMLPSQGDRRPWLLRQNYVTDFVATIFGRIHDGLAFTRNDAAIRA
jgi:phytoene dehydrogenase-like protein